jgi:[protein-PII] uridylyltransferase
MSRASGRPEKGSDTLQTGMAWRQIRETFTATGNGRAVAEALTQAVDGIVVEAYLSTIAPRLPAAALLAVGAFGRRELFPYSEVDIVIVRDAEAPPEFEEALAGFVQILWEKGLRPNLRVSAVQECAELRDAGIDFNVNLLDRRLLRGDRGTAGMLENALADFRAAHGAALAERLAALARARHAKFHGTACLQHPDVKESPGGIRDLHLIARLAKLSGRQARADAKIDDAAAFLSSVRCLLHYRSQSDGNDLDFDAQRSLQEQPFVRAESVAAFMREYFRHARAIFNEALRALEACESAAVPAETETAESQAPLSQSEFSVQGGRLFLREPAALSRDPELAFRLFDFVARRGVEPAAETRLRLEAARGALAAYCAQPRPLWPSLRSALSQPNAPAALRMLRDAGVLSSVFPEWSNIEGLIAAGPDHFFTVDEHALVAIDRIGELRAVEDAGRQRFSELLSETEDQAALFFALLFHQSGETADSSRQMARQAGARVQMPAASQDNVDFLIERQLDLSDAVSGRDLDDPATTRLLANRIGTVERLKMLAVLTYADVAAVHPEAMTPWRLEQLWRTYRLTRRECTRQLETDRILELPPNLSQRSEFIKGFPVRYLRARPASEIESHTRLYERSLAEGVAVELTPIEGAYSLAIVARDAPGIFASFAGAISSVGLDILKAEAFASSEGLVLDTFVVGDPNRTLEINPPEAERLRDLIRRVALGKTGVERLLRNRTQPGARRRAMEPQVEFDSEACETATLVEIAAEDRPGLLYSLAAVFSSNGCNIDVVLIDTKGHRAIDVFYVAREGRKLAPEFQTALKEELIAAC